ncbi:MAG: hypothetical protein AB7R89_13765 [Dehalococcoidia bacterium]
MRPTIDTRDRQMMTFLAHYLSQHGYAPSIREVADATGFTSNSPVWTRLDRLRERGLVTWEPRKERTLRIVGDAGRWLPEVSA